MCLKINVPGSMEAQRMVVLFIVGGERSVMECFLIEMTDYLDLMIYKQELGKCKESMTLSQGTFGLLIKSDSWWPGISLDDQVYIRFKNGECLRPNKNVIGPQKCEMFKC